MQQQELSDDKSAVLRRVVSKKALQNKKHPYFYQEQQESQNHQNHSRSQSPKNFKPLGEQSKTELPNIYLHVKRPAKTLINIDDKQSLLKWISQSLNFVNKKTSIINNFSLTNLQEETKPLFYDSLEYSSELAIISKIFAVCGINLKTKDVLICEGKNTSAKYAFFTNYPKHPMSLCCQSAVMIRHMNFVSTQYIREERSRSKSLPLKNLVVISCLKCQESILKIKIDAENSLQTQLPTPRSEFSESRRLVHFSKLISSGRFKKHLLSDKSVELMLSRSVKVDRSRTQLVRDSNALLLKPERAKLQSDLEAFSQYPKIRQRSRILTDDKFTKNLVKKEAGVSDLSQVKRLESALNKISKVEPIRYQNSTPL